MRRSIPMLLSSNKFPCCIFSGKVTKFGWISSLLLWVIGNNIKGGDKTPFSWTGLNVSILKIKQKVVSGFVKRDYPGDFGGNAHKVIFDAKFWWRFLQPNSLSRNWPDRRLWQKELCSLKWSAHWWGSDVCNWIQFSKNCKHWKYKDLKLKMT